MVYYHTPYDTSGNIGRYYNQVMSELPKLSDWVVFTDRDTWFPHPHYGKIIELYTKQKNYGLLTCLTNRVGTRYQCVQDMWNEENNLNHVKFAEGLYLSNGAEIQDITNNSPISGMLIMLNKETWLNSGGFKNDGLLGVDNSIHNNVVNKGGKVGLMTGMYIYHYYRNGVISDKKHLQNIEL